MTIDETVAPAPEMSPTVSIPQMRTRIDQIDTAMIALWRERAELSRTIGALRLRQGGTRLVLSREAEILQRFRAGIGADGVQLGLLVLRAGRGRLAAPPNLIDLAVNDRLAVDPGPRPGR
jgi:chorismate mutase